MQCSGVPVRVKKWEDFTDSLNEPQRWKSWRASEPRRQEWSCNRLPQSLDNTGSEVLPLSWKVNTMRKTAPFLEITVGDIQKMVEICLYSVLYFSFSHLFPYCLCNIGANPWWSPYQDASNYYDIIKSNQYTHSPFFLCNDGVIYNNPVTGWRNTRRCHPGSSGADIRDPESLLRTDSANASGLKLNICPIKYWHPF